MSASFLFVSCTPSTSQRQKELSYAEVKSYISRNAHHKRHRKTRFGEHVEVVTRKLSLVPTRPACRASLISPPLCGNSDPFDSQVVPVTAITNQIVSFAQLYHNKCWSPSFAPGIAPSTSAWRLMPCDSHVAVLSAAKSVWDLFVTDQGTFWAAISIAVHELKQLVTREQRHEIEKAGLQMKGRGLSDLRQTLANGLDIRPTINIIYHVKALFRESCGSGDLEAARLHARSFNWLINNLAPYAKPPSLLRVVLWSDAVYALRQLRRPVVYYSDWMPQLSRDICELASPLLAAMPRSPGDEPPECVLSSPLREAFLQAQYALHISTYLILESDSWDAAQEKELIFLWITTQAERHICKLLDLYFDLLEPRSVLPSTPNPSQRCTEAALTVALLYTLQKSFCAVILDNRSDLHESAGAVHQSLKQMAQQAHQHWSESEHSLYQQPYIWVLFVGATCEERLRLECSNGIDLNRASDMQWFHRELAKVAKLPHLTNWTDARVVLSRFALNERLDPNALVWFEATVHGSRPIE